MAPSSSTHFSTAFSKLSILRTSTEPKPSTFAPLLAVAMSLAIFSVFSTFLPMMQAFAPRCTIARTWALHIEPAPPVQKRTLPSTHDASQLLKSAMVVKRIRQYIPKMPSLQVSLTYSFLGTGIVTLLRVFTVLRNQNRHYYRQFSKER